MEEKHIRKILPVRGMPCASCTLTIEKELKKLEGVKDAQVSYLMEKVAVTYDPEKVGIPDIEGRIEKLGYKLAYKKYKSFFSRILRT
ncbi:heavy metal-associated domain-containing protein [Candidatus Hecatella orcuttiae]|jgi:Cu+-exporting ATPase|uniref:heavy metal-associated domain-containing protein n=1 Tax=Candidatus Hecatella orcuttiae TaxID=1935119 RepID=UPI00286823D5|nr:heavy metal-associated domain-containing protein [Candidatus Hecatella orcuttiae]